MKNSPTCNIFKPSFSDTILKWLIFHQQLHKEKLVVYSVSRYLLMVYCCQAVKNKSIFPYNKSGFIAMFTDDVPDVLQTVCFGFQTVSSMITILQIIKPNKILKWSSYAV